MAQASLDDDGLVLPPQDLSSLTPGPEDNGRLYNHDGTASITLTTGSTTTVKGYYQWDNAESAWRPMKSTETTQTSDADTLDGLDSIDFIQADGSIAYTGSQDMNGNNLLMNGGVVDFPDGHIEGNRITTGGSRWDVFDDTYGQIIASFYEGGDVDILNGSLHEQSNRVATRQWVENNTGTSDNTASHPKMIDLQGYGSPSNGDSIFDSALTDAAPGDTILFRDGTFVFSNGHREINKPVNLKFINAEIDDQRSGINQGECLFDWVGPGIQHTETLQADTDLGQTTITVSGSGWCSEGDTLYIEDTTSTEPIRQHVVVESVSGSGPVDITLQGTIRRQFSANADVHRVELMDPVVVDGMVVDGTVENGNQLRFDYCYRPEVRNLLAKAHGTHTVCFVDSFKCLVENCEARNAAAKTSGKGEPFYASKCTDTAWRDCTTRRTRRGIDVVLGSTGVYIENPNIHDYTKGGIAVHDGDAVSDITIIGGRIDSTDPSDGPNLSFGGAAKNVSVNGTKLTAHRRAILTSSDTRYTDVKIDLANSASADPTLVAIEQGSSNVTVDADVEIADYQNYTQVVDVRENCENTTLDLGIDIDGYSASGNENPLIGISSGCRDIDVLGHANTLSSFSSAIIRCYGSSSVIESVDIEMDVRNHGGKGVVMRGNSGVRDITVRNSRMDTDGDCIETYGYDDLSTCDYLWVRDCYLTSTNGVGIDIANGSEDYVYLLYNQAATSIDSGATNVTDTSNPPK